MPKEIPVRVEREIGSDGEPTGKTEFVVDELYHYYEPEFDVGRMQRRLVNAGYDFREFLPIINEMQRQYDALGATPAPAPAPAKKKATPPG